MNWVLPVQSRRPKDAWSIGEKAGSGQLAAGSQYVGGWMSATLDVGGKDHRTEDRWFKLLNIEQQNKEPQNDEVITSIFEISCSIFYGSKRRQLR